MVHFVWCLFHVERCQWEPSSAAASLGRVTTARDCVRFAFCRGWKTTTPDDDFGSLCFLDIQRKGTNMVHEISCPGVSCAGNDACPEGSLCANITRLILSEKGLSLSLNWQRNNTGQGRIGPHPPDSQSVLEPSGRFVPHNRIRGPEADRSIGRNLCWRKRSSVFAATRGRVHKWLPYWLPYLYDERRSPALVGFIVVV